MPLSLTLLFSAVRIYCWFRNLPTATKQKIRDWRDRGLSAPGPRPETDDPHEGPE